MKWAVGWDGQVGLYKAGTQSSGSGSSSRHLNFLVPAPTSRSFRFRLRLQNNVVNWKPKTIVILVKLAFAANYVCGSGTQISGCGSTVKNFWLRLQPSKIAWVPVPGSCSGSTALYKASKLTFYSSGSSGVQSFWWSGETASLYARSLPTKFK